MPLPGFSGYVAPDCQRPLVLKTAVSSRLPLAERAEIAQQRQRALAVTPDPTSSFGTGSYFLPKRHVGVTTFGLGSQAFVRNASDVPERQKDSTAKVSEGLALPFEATTVSKEASAAYARPSDPGFFSRVRQVERNDDDARHSLEDPKTRSGAAKNLRCTAIQNKRELDATFAPPPMEFQKVPRTRPVTLYANQDVSFGKAHLLTANSTNQTDFPNPRDTAVAATGVLRAKSPETRLACDRALVTTATSRDLFAGTPKASEDVASGFMGHVPQHPSNVDRVNGAADPLRAHTKCFVNVSAPTAASQTSLTRAKIAAAIAAAAAAGQPVPPPQNVTNFYLSQAAESKVERQMNRVEVGRKNAVRGFFSRGVGDQDDIVADQFCLRFRPLEGVMRHGPPNTHGWISAAELHRAPRL